MKRYRIKGRSIITTLTRKDCLPILDDLGADGFLNCAPEEMLSVKFRDQAGRRIVAHISASEISLLPQMAAS